MIKTIREFKLAANRVGTLKKMYELIASRLEHGSYVIDEHDRVLVSPIYIQYAEIGPEYDGYAYEEMKARKILQYNEKALEMFFEGDYRIKLLVVDFIKGYFVCHVEMSKK